MKAQPCEHRDPLTRPLSGLGLGCGYDGLEPAVTRAGEARYLVCQPPLQLGPLLGMALLLLAERCFLLLHQALGSLQVGLLLPHSTAQRLLLCAQHVQP